MTGPSLPHRPPTRGPRTPDASSPRGRGRGPEPSVARHELSDPGARIALGIIDGRAQGRADGRVTQTEVERAEHAADIYRRCFLDASAPEGQEQWAAFTRTRAGRRWETVSPYEWRALQDGLSDLRARLHGEVCPLPGPFCTLLPVSAIPGPSLRITAAKIAKAYGAQSSVLELESVSKAYAALQDRSSLENDDSDTAKLVKSLRQEAVQGLLDFMMTGHGGLLLGSDVVVQGKVFHEVYELPRSDLPIDARIAHAEEAIAGCGLSRFYVLRNDDKLELVVHEGDLGQIDLQTSVEVRDDESRRYDHLGKVVYVNQLNDTLGNATVGAWRRLAKNTTHALRDRAKCILQGELPTSPALWALPVVGLGAGLSLGDTSVTAVLAGAGIVYTALNVADCLETQRARSRTPIYNLLGLALGRAPA